MICEQKIVTWCFNDGAYHNAWDAGSFGSIEKQMIGGWLIKHIRDDRDRTFLWILFERDTGSKC